MELSGIGRRKAGIVRLGIVPCSLEYHHQTILTLLAAEFISKPKRIRRKTGIKLELTRVECDFMIREYRAGISRCSDHIFIVMEMRVSR